MFSPFEIAFGKLQLAIPYYLLGSRPIEVVDTMITSSSYTEFSQCYYGPFKILDIIGPVAYHLDLPLTSKIQHVFHCCLLKPQYSPIESKNPSLPPTSINNNPIVTHLSILASKWCIYVTPHSRGIFVQW